MQGPYMRLSKAPQHYVNISWDILIYAKAECNALERKFNMDIFIHLD